MTPFIKDYLAYFTDHELSDYDIKRLNEIHERHAVATKIIELPAKVVIREKIVRVPQKIYIEKHRDKHGEYEVKVTNPLDVQGLIENISSYWGMTYDEAMSTCRKRELVHCRYHIYAILHENGYNITTIARIFHKDHTTVISGLREVSRMLEIKERPFYYLYNHWIKNNQEALMPIFA